MSWEYLLDDLPTVVPDPITGAPVPITGPVRDIMLDDDGDLYLANGDMALTSGGIAARQGAGIRLGLFLGEWFLTPENPVGFEGIPYLERVFIKNPNLGEVREWFRLAIEDTPDIEVVYKVILGLTKDRKMQVFWHAATPSGAAIINSQGVSVP